MEATARTVPRLASAGADLIELGIPFSDPIADGPTIQAAGQRSLQGGTTPRKVLDLAAALRRDGLEPPLLLMTYLNPILAFGLGEFFQRASDAGVDGVLVPDLPLDEEAPIKLAAGRHGLDLVLFAGPTTHPDRLARIGRETQGFLYFLSITGVTGARGALPPELPGQLAAARAASRAPVAVGFGISSPEQARALAPHVDGIVVGSAIVRELHEGGGEPDRPAELVRRLASALRQPT